VPKAQGLIEPDRCGEAGIREQYNACGTVLACKTQAGFNQAAPDAVAACGGGDRELSQLECADPIRDDRTGPNYLVPAKCDKDLAARRDDAAPGVREMVLVWVLEQAVLSEPCPIERREGRGMDGVKRRDLYVHNVSRVERRGRSLTSAHHLPGAAQCKIPIRPQGAVPVQRRPRVAPCVVHTLVRRHVGNPVAIKAPTWVRRRAWV